MKNKRLWIVLAAIVVVVVALIASQSTSSTKSTQKAEKAKVGVLQYVTHEALDEIYRGIVSGLEESGYGEDAVSIDFLNAEGDQSKVQTMSQTLVNNGNDVLIGIATPSAQGLASTTKEIPIVMGAVTDPVGAKLVSDLENPGGNITGVSDKTPIGEQVELIGEITPDVKTIGIIYASSEDNSKSQVEEFKSLAEKAGYKVEEYSVPSTNEIKTTMSVMTSKVDAVWIPLDNTIASAFSTVVAAANEANIPIYPSVDTMVEEGGLASVVVDQYELGVATGKMAAAILDGEDVAKMPVQIFDEGKPVLNKKAAEKLGITFSDDIVKSAETVIE